MAETRATGRDGRPLYLAAVVAAGALLLYTLTLTPDILPADNGEFQLAAATLGVAHPPGYPLHTLLGAALARLPLGSLPWRVNWLSAWLAAITLALTAASVQRLTGRWLAALASALVLGTSTTFWAQATISNVRTLTALFTALAVYALALHGEQRSAGRDDRALLLLAAALGLGLTHHLSLAFIGLVMMVYLLLVDRSLLRQLRRWLAPALVALLCLLPLLYLPLRRPELAELRAFLHYALGLGFSGDFFYFVAPAELWARLRVMGNVLAFQFQPLVLVAGVLAAGLLLWKRRQLALLLVGGFALHTFITATYRAPQTVEYMLPAYVLFAITLGVGLGVLAEPGRAWSSGLYALALVLLLLAGLSQGVARWPSYRLLAQNGDTRETLAPILDGAPDGAIVLCDWHWFAPLRYLQQVEGQRPDLRIEYVAPGGEPYEETWARRIREELPQRPVVVTHYHELAYQSLPVLFEPLGEAFLVRATPRRDLPETMTPAALALGNTLTVAGYALEPGELQLDAPLDIVLAWRLERVPAGPLTLFVHLLGYDGAVYAQEDLLLDTGWLAPGDLALTRFHLDVRPGALPGRYSVQVGAYDPAGPLALAGGEAQGELLGVELAPAAQPLYTNHPRRRSLGEGLALVGVDWDLSLPQEPRLYLHWRALRDSAALELTLLDGASALLPVSVPALPAGGIQTTAHTLAVQPGRPRLLAPDGRIYRLPTPAGDDCYLPLGAGIVYLGAAPAQPAAPYGLVTLHFAASRPVLRDYVVSAALIGYNPDQTWAWRDLDDWVPAMGAIPTLKWIAGSRISDPHTLAVPADAPAGPVVGTLVLYDAFTGRKLPLLDERLAARAPWAPMGEWLIQP